MDSAWKSTFRGRVSMYTRNSRVPCSRDAPPQNSRATCLWSTPHRNIRVPGPQHISPRNSGVPGTVTERVLFRVLIPLHTWTCWYLGGPGRVSGHICLGPYLFHNLRPSEVNLLFGWGRGRSSSDDGFPKLVSQQWSERFVSKDSLAVDIPVAQPSGETSFGHTMSVQGPAPGGGPGDEWYWHGRLVEATHTHIASESVITGTSYESSAPSNK